MTKKEMINEMFDKGYHSQYTPEWFEKFTYEQVKRMYESYMAFLKEGEKNC